MTHWWISYWARTHWPTTTTTHATHATTFHCWCVFIHYSLVSPNFSMRQRIFVVFFLATASSASSFSSSRWQRVHSDAHIGHTFMCVWQKYKFAPVDDGSPLGILKWNTAEKSRNVAQCTKLQNDGEQIEIKTQHRQPVATGQSYVVICGEREDRAKVFALLMSEWNSVICILFYLFFACFSLRTAVW